MNVLYATCQYILQLKQNTLKERLEAITLNGTHNNGHTENFDSTEEELSRQLKRVALCLKRIENNAYGYCDRCGSLINRQWLQFRPEAEFCLSCKNEWARERR